MKKHVQNNDHWYLLFILMHKQIDSDTWDYMGDALHYYSVDEELKFLVAQALGDNDQAQAD